MIELIFSTLAEFGLIREDYKHRKRVSEKENKDDKKRKFQKYFLQPSSLIMISVLVVFSLSAFLYFTIRKPNMLLKSTELEIEEMSKKMDQWMEKFGKYPSNMDELISNSPVRQEWKSDSWKKAYQFLLIENGQKYFIISAGPDGKFDTEDDIKSK